MDKKLTHVGALQKGSYVILDGEACRVTTTQVSRPGKHGHAKVRFDAVGIIDGKKRNTVLPAHDSIEVPLIDKRTAQVLSVAGTTANVMDSESYETFDMEIPTEFEGKMTEGSNVLYWVILGKKMIQQIKEGE